MTNLRQLLSTWENWSARDTLTRALTKVSAEDSREPITRSLAATPAATALDVLRDSAELVELLTSWRWQAIYAARREGASWEQIGAATRLSVEAARAFFVAAIERQETVLGVDVAVYRQVL